MYVVQIDVIFFLNFLFIKVCNLASFAMCEVLYQYTRYCYYIYSSTVETVKSVLVLLTSIILFYYCYIILSYQNNHYA